LSAAKSAGAVCGSVKKLLVLRKHQCRKRLTFDAIYCAYLMTLSLNNTCTSSTGSDKLTQLVSTVIVGRAIRSLEFLVLDS